MSGSSARILVTGFSPFGVRALPLGPLHGNRSRDICQRLQDKSSDVASRIHVEILDVDQWTAKVTPASLSKFGHILQIQQPVGVFMLGEVQTPLTGLRVEPCAVDKGRAVTGQFAGNAAASATVRSTTEKGLIPGHVSGASGIGEQGCNEVYLAAQRWARKQRVAPPVLFVHCGFRDSITTELLQVRRYLWEMIDTIWKPKLP